MSTSRTLRTSRTAAQVTVAASLAAAALVLGTGTAQAQTPDGPGQLQVAPHVDPDGPVIANPTPEPQPDPAPEDPELPVVDQPEPQPDPKPQGPGDITDTPDCTHGCGGGNGGDGVPDDKAPAPQDESGDAPSEDPAHDAPLDQGCFTGCDLPEQDVAPVLERNVLTPNRIDAGQDSATSVLNADQDETGLGYYVGLGLVSVAGAAGVALAARRLARANA